MTKTDSVFLKRFSQIIAGLVALTLVLILFAYYMHVRFYSDEKRGIGSERLQVQTSEEDARIQPVAGVYSGETGKAEQEKARAAAAAAALKQVAYDGTLDGGVIYGKLCGTCHTNGAGGAPMLLKAAWAARVAQGEDTMIKHAREGYKGEAGIMPARGGNPSLNDEQVAATVKWMVSQLK